jgi:O-antigen/teichoic acid export membrane protein
MCARLAKLKTVAARTLPGFWALADQAAASLGSFLLMLILTRDLPQADFGAYTLIYSALLLLNAIHSPVVVYPMVVVGAHTVKQGASALVGMSLLMTAALGAVLAPLLAAGFLLVTDARTAWTAAALVPAWQIQETLRRAHMARLDHRRALLGDCVTYLVPPALALLLAQIGSLTLWTALCAMETGFVLGALAQAATLRIGRCARVQIAAWIGESWRLGRWLLFTTLVNLGSMQILPWLLAYWHGLAALAAIRAVVNPATICHPLMFSLGNLVIPVVARARAQGPDGAAGRIGIRTGLALAVLIAPYFFVLAAFPETALRLFYGAASPYVSEGGGLRLVVLCYSSMLLAMVFEASLKGLERTREVFVAQFASIAATLIGGVPLTYFFGLQGALIGSCLSMGALLLWYVWTLVVRREIHHRHDSGAPLMARSGFSIAALEEPVE